MSAEEERDIARTLVKLIHENDDVKSAVISLVCSCPNLVKQY